VVRAIGLDIVDTARICRGIEKYGDRFVRRILGADELRLFASRVDKAQFLAGRFAAKEAAIKALADFLPTRPPYHAIQVLNANGGQPSYVFTPEIAKVLKHLTCMVSITHEKSVAAAMAVFSDAEGR